MCDRLLVFTCHCTGCLFLCRVLLLSQFADVHRIKMPKPLRAHDRVKASVGDVLWLTDSPYDIVSIDSEHDVNGVDGQPQFRCTFTAFLTAEGWIAPEKRHTGRFIVEWKDEDGMWLSCSPCAFFVAPLRRFQMCSCIFSRAVPYQS